MLTKEKLQSDLTEAMRRNEAVSKRTLRMVLSAVKLAEVERMGALEEADLLAVLGKEVKLRQEALQDARKAGRDAMVGALLEELECLRTYLPEPLEREALQELARGTIAELGAAGLGDMGKVMRALMPKIAGRADGKVASQVVRELLNG